MSLDLDTPLDKSIQRIVRKVRVGTLEYEYENQQVVIRYELLDASGQVIDSEGLMFRLTDKDLFEKDATLKAFGDVQKLAAYGRGDHGYGEDRKYKVIACGPLVAGHEAALLKLAAGVGVQP